MSIAVFTRLKATAARKTFEFYVDEELKSVGELLEVAKERKRASNVISNLMTQLGGKETSANGIDMVEYKVTASPEDAQALLEKKLGAKFKVVNNTARTPGMTYATNVAVSKLKCGVAIKASRSGNGCIVTFEDFSNSL